MSSRGALRFMTPYLIGTAVLVAIPAALTFVYAFTNHTGLTDPQFNGLENLRFLARDPFFFASLRASAIHVAIAVPLRLLIATTLGLLLAAPRPGARWYRALVYLPTVIPDIAMALLFLWVLNPLYGPLNAALRTFGLPQPNWLGTPWGARFGVVMLLLFPIGEAFLVVLATRRQVNQRLYEAAALDGAGPFQQLRRITLPLMAPVLVLLAIRDMVLTLQVNFVPGYMLTDGGPANATLYLPLYIFDNAFEFARFGYGATITLVLMAITVVLVALQLLLVRRWRILR